MNSTAAVNGIGQRATQFVPPLGEFDRSDHLKYKAGDPTGGAFLFPDFDPRVRNAQIAVQNTQAFGAPLPQGMGMMAGILPAALKIEEHKKMQEIATKYYEKYIKDFNSKYGFTDVQIEGLVREFKDVTEEICRLIPDEEMKNMYRKYIESYPTMYLSMIPQEALQTKLAVKCVTENATLRRKVEEMSSSVSSLVKNLTDLQISAGIPPIVNLMFESMPDPLTAITDPMYHQYNDSIVTYHKLLKNADVNVNLTVLGNDGRPQVGNPDNVPNNQLLRIQPLHFLDKLVEDLEDAGTNYPVPNTATPPVRGQNTTQPSGAAGVAQTLHFGSDSATGPLEAVPVSDIKALKTVMSNMHTQSGCQPFGDEWNHTGPTPAMNPAMCLDEKDKFQTGNPRHEVGRTNLYQAKRDPRGNAVWVQAGDIPALSGGAQQMVTPTAPGWNGVSHMPGVDSRPPMPTAGQLNQMRQQQPMNQTQPQLAQPFQQRQSYSMPYEVVREYEAPKKPRGSKKSKGANAKRSSKGSKTKSGRKKSSSK
ncbi:unnamed protein product [Ectocarpus sp. 12 AP-2014]